MRKTKEQKAITLIALIITIVVLLILAVVAINAVTGDGIIQHATNAKASYEKAQAEENSMIAYYQTYLDNKGDVGPWKQEGNIIYMTDATGKKIELKIGDKVNFIEPAENSKTYSISYDYNIGELKTEKLEWRVLGITENGKIELISTTPTTGNIVLRGEKGFLDSINIFNNACDTLYSTNKGVARNLTLEDINKLAGITTDEKKKEQNVELFGIKREYKYENNIIRYRESSDYGTTWGEWKDSDYTIFKYPGKTEINGDNSIQTYTITDDNYYYIISDNINITTRDNLSMADIINGNTGVAQWLATQSISFSNTSGEAGLTKFAIKVLLGDRTYKQTLFDSYQGSGGSGDYYSIRPVITLNSNIELRYIDNDCIWEIN